MQFNQQVTITGIKKFKGEVEGKVYDSFKVFASVSLDESRGNAKGYASEEYNVGSSDEYDKWVHLDFPVLADATFEITTTGKASKMSIKAIKPVKKA
jgi:uncharacterized protein (DUF2141 family)